MGMFSWKTQDTNKSISNVYSERDTFKVIMTDNNNNQYIEFNYEGYGMFDNMDYYSLVDTMNGGNGDREKGIELFFNPNKDTIFPSLSENGKYYNGKRPNDCEFQGYFYE